MTERRLHESARRALEQAQAEAARLGHEVVGSEHVLLGVLRTSPLADEVLRELGIDSAQVQQRLESGPKRCAPAVRNRRMGRCRSRPMHDGCSTAAAARRT